MLAQGTPTQALAGKTCTESSTELGWYAVAERCGPYFQSAGKLWSAKVKSQRSITPVTLDGRQGRVEIVAKMPLVPNGDYSWPFQALWMMPFSITSNPFQSLDWPHRGEIDIAEGILTDGKITSAMHFSVGPKLMDERNEHVFGFTWDNLDLVFSINDTVTMRMPMSELGKVQEYFFQPGGWQVIINYAIHNGKGDTAIAALTNTTPMEIKAVRFLREKQATFLLSKPPRSTEPMSASKEPNPTPSQWPQAPAPPPTKKSISSPPKPNVPTLHTPAVPSTARYATNSNHIW
ncbi:hypothetical protein HK102_010372 [Quaeritorhiza haematococci]|nr:hypothetical protein HK102_010372 [Quaeritorhiza haematococci]